MGSESALGVSAQAGTEKRVSGGTARIAALALRRKLRRLGINMVAS
jgi:hypothetical protein